MSDPRDPMGLVPGDGRPARRFQASESERRCYGCSNPRTYWESVAIPAAAILLALVAVALVTILWAKERGKIRLIVGRSFEGRHPVVLVSRTQAAKADGISKPLPAGKSSTSTGAEPQPMQLKLISESPRIVVIENFLTTEECKHLMEVATPLLQRSTVLGHGNASEEDETKTSGSRVISRVRTSHSAKLKRKHTGVVDEIEKRAALIAGIPLDNLEPLQVVRYRPGQFYREHLDAFVSGTPGAEESLRQGGQRTTTVFCYLTDGEEPTKENPTAGHTRFPKLGVSFQPVRGRAVMWSNCKEDGSVDDRTLHAGEAPTKGEKFGANIWFRAGKFH